MDDVTKDLPGVAIYLDDILVSGKNARDHLHNLKQLLQRLYKNGLALPQRNVVLPNPVWNTWAKFFLNEEFLKDPKEMQFWTCQHPKMFPHYDLFLDLYSFTRSSYLLAFLQLLLLFTNCYEMMFSRSRFSRRKSI